MTARSVGELQPVVNRPGMLSRNLIGSEHGVTSFYLVELVLEKGAEIPLHTHPIEEVFVVEEGALTMRLGEQTVEAGPDAVVRIPPGVPHAVVNARPAPARALAAAAWDRATFFRDATTYLEGQPRD